MASQFSSISQALAGKTSSLNIPKPASVGDSVTPFTMTKDAAFTGEAKVGVVTRAMTSGLPTPPNSISPNLPPHAFRAKLANELAASPPEDHVDSDIDLQDAVDHANSQDLAPPPTSDPHGHEGVGLITPAYLAKHHLSGLVLEKGPIAIRHVMNHLCQAIPGFSDVPPAKARRIVVAALENPAGGGLKGDVEFEKVGWGRWDARIKGQPSRDGGKAMYSIKEGQPSKSTAGTAALKIPGASGRVSKSRRVSHGSWTGDPGHLFRFEHGDRMDTDVAEHEADQMSIDDEERTGARQRGGNYTFDTCFDSDTDEEDWQSMGAAALKQGSFGSLGGRGRYLSTSMVHIAGGRSLSRSPFPRSVPIHSIFKQHIPRSFTPATFSPSAHMEGVEMDPMEREAAEALVRMGSM